MPARDDFAGWEARFRAGLENALDDIVKGMEYVATDIIAAEAVDRGALLGSFEIRKPEPLVRVLANTSRHAVFSEYGTRPHWPPFKPILDWVRRNLSVSTFQGLSGTEKVYSFKAKAGRRVRSEALLERVARAVQAKIAREGTKPVAFMRRAAAATQPKVGTIVRKHMRRAGLA